MLGRAHMAIGGAVGLALVSGSAEIEWWVIPVAIIAAGLPDVLDSENAAGRDALGLSWSSVRRTMRRRGKTAADMVLVPVRTLGALGTAERIPVGAGVAKLAGHVFHHLLGHGLRAFAQTIERKRFLLRRFTEIAVLQGLFGTSHRLVGALQRTSRIAAEATHILEKLLELIAQFALTLS